MARDAPDAPDLSSDGQHFSCSLTAVVIGRVRRAGGDAAVEQLLRESGSPRTCAYLEDLGNWVSYDEAIGLWEAGAQVTGEPHFARAVGQDFVSQLAGSGNSTVLRALGSPEALLRNIANAGHRFSTTADLEAIEISPGHAEIHAVACPGFIRHPLHCDWTAGLLSQVTALFGLPPAMVEHDECQALGAPVCRYRLSWDASVDHELDPARQAAALRTQLQAMSARLQDVFDTASDLIASGDLERTLARITDRAAHQVRAPRYLLAVRPTPDSDLHYHHKGLSGEEATVIADRALGEAAGSFPDHWLVADVRSHRHHYGALVAIQVPGTPFFSHERQLLEVYARYAATALDTATALSEAEARHAEAQYRYEESRALLDLARRLAQAGSSDQVARRFAEAVPAVIDCDRVGVYLWWEDRGELVRQAVCAPALGPTPPVGLRSVRPNELPLLAQWVQAPDSEPVFIDLETWPLRSSLRELGAVASVAVPIASEDRLLGCFVVSVLSDPDRLAPGPELIDRLSGVAAHAVTALDNGRLVDHITHQASHDQLTGAANRAGFTEQLSVGVDRARDAGTVVALFYIDLNEFKPINDTHGHGVGDELLRAVAQRLMGQVRARDTVGRLGGDEFVVLVEAEGDEQAADLGHRIARAFDQPFAAGGETFAVSASIGHAVWPSEVAQPDQLLRHADQAMYKVKHATRSSLAAGTPT